MLMVWKQYVFLHILNNIYNFIERNKTSKDGKLSMLYHFLSLLWTSPILITHWETKGLWKKKIPPENALNISRNVKPKFVELETK